MRLASLLFRHRRQLLMQLNTIDGPTASLSSRIGSPLKRSSSHTTAQNKTDSSGRGLKQARLASPPGKQMASTSSRQNVAADSSNRRGRSGRSRPSRHGGRGRGGGHSVKKVQPTEPSLPGPLLDQRYLNDKYKNVTNTGNDIGPDWKGNPKSALSNFMISKLGRAPVYDVAMGQVNGKKIAR